MNLFISSDHAGFKLKQRLIAYLEDNAVKVMDKGPFEFNEHDDYPDWIAEVAREVSADPENARGIVIGLSGQGEAMAANKFKNVRAGVYYGGPEEIVTLLRQHNNCNVLSLGAKFVTPEQAEKIVDLWIDTQFSGEERHQRRIDKMLKLEH